ncbi:MAG: hypothetical protein ACU0BF_12225 [Paracoccaceae bacterium]
MAPLTLPDGVAAFEERAAAAEEPATEPAPLPADAPPDAVYAPVVTRMLDDTLVAFDLLVSGARGEGDVIRFADCVAAQYALIRGYGFARHLRTTAGQEGGEWRADAVYTVSPAFPGGMRTLDAEVVVADCKAAGIPTA